MVASALSDLATHGSQPAGCEATEVRLQAGRLLPPLRSKLQAAGGSGLKRTPGLSIGSRWQDEMCLHVRGRNDADDGLHERGGIDRLWHVPVETCVQGLLALPL